MIFARRLLPLLLGALLLVGCGPNRVMVHGQFPTPLMTKLPVTLGVYYSEEFRNHSFHDISKTRGESDWIVSTGQAQLEMFNVLLSGMFEQVLVLDTAPGSGDTPPLVDAILVPAIDELQYAIPRHTKVKVYEIWMRYRYRLTDPSGALIADWVMTAYGKTPTAFLRSDEAAVNLAAVVALRDAGANFALNFPRVPEVQQWLESLFDPQETGP